MCVWCVYVCVRMVCVCVRVWCGEVAFVCVCVVCERVCAFEAGFVILPYIDFSIVELALLSLSLRLYGTRLRRCGAGWLAPAS